MLTKDQKLAVHLLFKFSEEEVARQLDISEETLQSWMQNPEFAQALQDRIIENRRSAARILSRLYVESIIELGALIKSDDEKNKPKAIMEVLKLSGLFKEVGFEEGDTVSQLLERLAGEDEEA